MRMIRLVLLPMVIGPYIGSRAIKNSPMRYVEARVEKTILTPIILLLLAAVETVAVIPIIVLKRRKKA